MTTKVIERRCSRCKELWPLIEFRVAGNAYSEHCEICRLVVQDWIDSWQKELAARRKERVGG